MLFWVDFVGFSRFSGFCGVSLGLARGLRGFAVFRLLFRFSAFDCVFCWVFVTFGGGFSLISGWPKVNLPLVT